MEIAEVKDIKPRTGRRAKCIMIVGKPGTGKSTLSINIAKKIASNSKTLLVLASPDDWSEVTKPCNIFDKKQCDYIGVKHYIYNVDSDFRQIYANFHNSLIVFDDTKAYVKANFEHSEIRNFLLRRRQQMIDVIFSAHGFAEIPPRMFSFITDWVILPINDSPEVRKRDITNPDTYSKLCEIVERVNAKGKHDIHYSEFYKVD